MCYNYSLIYTVYAHRCETGQKSLAKDLLFYLFLKLAQIIYIFLDNVGIIYLSCNAKKLKKKKKNLPICLKRAETSIFLIIFMVFLVMSTFILLLFLSVTLHESCTRRALLGPWLNNTEVYLTPLLVLKIILLQ